MQKSPSLLKALDSPGKLQEIFAGFREGGAGGHGRAESEEATAGNTSISSNVHEALERDLMLSAQLGLALLEKQQLVEAHNVELVAKQKELETSVSQLLDRLASSYKDNAQLERVSLLSARPALQSRLD